MGEVLNLNFGLYWLDNTEIMKNIIKTVLCHIHTVDNSDLSCFIHPLLDNDYIYLETYLCQKHKQKRIIDDELMEIFCS